MENVAGALKLYPYIPQYGLRAQFKVQEFCPAIRRLNVVTETRLVFTAINSF